MDTELVMIVCMASGGVLGALGGYRWKWLRRFVLPIILGIMATIVQKPPISCLYMTLGLMIAFHLGYGERTPYWLKFLVGCSFVAPTLFLGFTIWQIITPISFIAMFKLSNTIKWAGSFSWKIVEFLTFSLVGVTVANLIVR